MEDKVYTPETIVETPFPGEPLPFVPTESSKTGDTYSPAVAKDKTFKQKRVATELLSQALNTRSRNILQEFELQQTGGFKVGNFKEGVSGDLRITPNGLTARDIAGLTTFAIDGATGDAFFRGEVRAADFTVIDDGGLISLSAFDSDTKTVFLKSTTSGTYTDVPGLSLDLTLERETRVLILLNIDCTLSNIVDTGNSTGLTIIHVDEGITNIILGVTTVPMYTANYTATFSSSFTLSGNDIVTLAPGAHTIKALFKILGSGAPVNNITSATLTYITFGR